MFCIIKILELSAQYILFALQKDHRKAGWPLKQYIMLFVP